VSASTVPCLIPKSVSHIPRYQFSVGASDAIYTVEAIESILFGNDTLATLGVSLDTIVSLDPEPDIDLEVDPDAVYCLQVPDEAAIAPRATEETLAETIAEQYGGIGVTFSSEVADQYPSLRYLAPGSPTLRWLVGQSLDTDSGRALAQTAFGYGPTGDVVATDQQPWIVCGWTDADAGSQLVALDETGDAVPVADLSTLEEWAKAFLQNRNRANLNKMCE